MPLTVLNDLFNVADGTAVNTLGYVVYDGRPISSNPAADKLKVLTGSVVGYNSPGSTDGAVAIYNTDVLGTNSTYDVSVVGTSLIASGQNIIGVYARNDLAHADASFDGIHFWVNKDTFWIYEGNTLKTIASLPSGNLSAGDHTVTMSVTGNTFICKLDGSPIGTVTSASGAAYHGVGFVLGRNIADLSGGYVGSFVVSRALLTPGVPVAPVAAQGVGRVSVTWTPVGDPADTYNIYRSSNGGAFTLLTTSATASYTDTAVAGGTTYAYKVSATNTTGTSAQSTAGNDLAYVAPSGGLPLGLSMSLSSANSKGS